MDTSETYVKMRIAAIPDLGYGTPLEETFRSEQHYILENDSYSVFIASNGNWHTFHPAIPSNGEQGRTCQLERQDQLQEMARDKFIDIWAMFAKFGRYCDEWGGNAGKFNTGEQLWLAFVMKQKGKVWDGNEWIKSSPPNK